MTAQPMTAQDAREDIIFAIQNNEVVETNLYDFIMASADETTSPDGAEMKLHLRHESYNWGSKSRVNNQDGMYEVWDWGWRGQYPRFLAAFDTEEEAEDYVFQSIEADDFAKDDHRDTMYYNTREEAEAALAEMNAEKE